MDLPKMQHIKILGAAVGTEVLWNMDDIEFIELTPATTPGSVVGSNPPEDPDGSDDDDEGDGKGDGKGGDDGKGGVQGSPSPTNKPGALGAAPGDKETLGSQPSTSGPPPGPTGEPGCAEVEPNTKTQPVAASQPKEPLPYTMTFERYGAVEHTILLTFLYPIKSY
jgi:hypothetical protein